MSISSNRLPGDDIYLFNAQSSEIQLSTAVIGRLCKAEALALVGMSARLENQHPDIISHYLWAISDFGIEAKYLYEKQLEKENSS